MEFIQVYWLEISIGILTVIGLMIYAAWQIKKNGLRGAIVKLIVEAESEFNKGQNENKINYVIDKVLTLLPTPLSLFITREVVRDFIQKVFDEIKEALDF